MHLFQFEVFIKWKTSFKSNFLLINDQFSLQVDKIIGSYIIHLLYSPLLSCIIRVSDDIFEGKRVYPMHLPPDDSSEMMAVISRANCINSPLSTQKRNSALALSSIHVEQRHIAVPICGLPLNAEYSSGPTWHKKDLELCRTDVSDRYDAYRRVSELDNFRKITGWHANLECHVRVKLCK